MVQLVHHATPGASQPQCYTTHKQKTSWGWAGPNSTLVWAIVQSILSWLLNFSWGQLGSCWKGNKYQLNFQLGYSVSWSLSLVEIKQHQNRFQEAFSYCSFIHFTYIPDCLWKMGPKPYQKSWIRPKFGITDHNEGSITYFF